MRRTPRRRSNSSPNAFYKFHTILFEASVQPKEGSAGLSDARLIAIIPNLGVDEDPVTGSLNAGIGTWFFGSGRAAGSYTVRQGVRVGANGFVRVSRDEDGIWVAGATRSVVSGTVAL